ncbi:MAG: CRISPR-associated endonuclease Cas3'', partial [Candidatus Bathyarchaeia archaeon]
RCIFMKIYAYNDGDRVETLERHITAGLRYMQEIYLKNMYHRHISKRLNVSDEDSINLLKVAYMLHDLGKAYDPFQTRIIEGHGAPGHEVLSSYVAVKHCKVLDENLTRSVALSILLHHHAMRTLSEAFIQFCEVKHFTISMEKAEWLKRNVYADVLNFLPNSLTSEQVVNVLMRELNRLITPKLSEGLGQIYATAYLILHPLMVCDNLSAYTAKFGGDIVKVEDLDLGKLRNWIREFLLSVL